MTGVAEWDDEDIEDIHEIKHAFSAHHEDEDANREIVYAKTEAGAVYLTLTTTPKDGGIAIRTYLNLGPVMLELLFDTMLEGSLHIEKYPAPAGAPVPVFKP